MTTNNTTWIPLNTKFLVLYGCKTNTIVLSKPDLGQANQGAYP